MVCHYVVETSRDRGRNNSPGNKNLSFFSSHICSARDYVQSYNTQSVVLIGKFRNNILC